MNGKEKQASELFEKYKSGTIFEEDKLLLRSWYNERARSAETNFSDTEMELELDQIWLSLSNKTGKAKIWNRIAVAASIFMIAAAGLFYYKYNIYSAKKSIKVADQEIKPGGNKAYLTLANGKKISLLDEPNGTVIKEAGIKIVKNASGQLTYASQATDAPANPNSINTIETPNGGQYQVILPDGTKIWLNAASSVSYPVSFVSKAERRVKLIGEAYFEVAKDKKHPFIVECDQQEVQVTGTHFNINSYKEELGVKTSLFEGSVIVKPTKNPAQNTILASGEQSVLIGGIIKTGETDMESDLAWKNGMFVFKNESLKNIMKQIACWYDVKVVFVGDVGSVHFEGFISRSQNISEVLRKFQLTKSVRFRIEGRSVTVMH